MADKPVLWLPRRVSDATIARARESYEVILNEADDVSTADEIVAMSARVDAMMPCHSEIFSADVVSRLDPRLKILANHSVGTDHCDLAALKARGIAVTNTPDVLSDATAEIAILLMLGAARRAVEGDRIVRSGAWDFWSPSFMVGKQVSGARLAIVGMGRVGQALAKKARGFDMEIHYYNRQRLPEDKEYGATYHSSLESLLPNGDFLSLHCPATPETKNLLNADTLKLLPAGCVVVNTARGALVDEAALISALRSGHAAAAGLDCFAKEPGGNPAFADFENVFMLPHIGSATVRTRDAMGFRALDNLNAFFAGKTPRDLL
ncbi:D-glycerate dehydrogenase [uncultured Roseibium sp.]|uniref:2-hydroxyacid dehydrogenase n=1 Tax=uncultured Roseibium sp. TaxID=1936171 RepID=UPI003216B4D1